MNVTRFYISSIYVLVTQKSSIHTSPVFDQLHRPFLTGVKCNHTCALVSDCITTGKSIYNLMT